jgi:hypothetical protein
MVKDGKHVGINNKRSLQENIFLNLHNIAAMEELHIKTKLFNRIFGIDKTYFIIR